MITHLEISDLYDPDAFRIKLKAVPEKKEHSCDGCVFNSGHQCEFPDSKDELNNCGERGIIWKAKLVSS